MAKLGIKIRKAVEADLSDIVNVWKRNIKTANTASDIADLFHSFKKYFLVAVYTDTTGTGTNKEGFEDKDRIIGFVGGAIRSGHGHISGIAVDKEYRMKGVGKRLLKAVDVDFLADGLDRVTLEVRKSDTGAIRFYEKQGYKRLYIAKRYYADGEDAIVHEKKIWIKKKL
ncbi:MAG TPA: GNAT family N-acetyltransferase [Methanophagales archaeon]|nr:GNAT family N-acetyltransferase [Methanophagales archaeon]